VIVDKFMDERAASKEMDLTEVQEKFIRNRKELSKKSFVYTMTDLHLLSEPRKRVNDFVGHYLFERGIMTCIIVYTMLMAAEVFPELETPELQTWRDFRTGVNFFFGAVFLIEAILKLYAMRLCYFRDNWNCFDFGCVSASVGGVILEYSNSGINISSLASVVRIFRIARLFRLLNLEPLRNLNKLFSSLALSMVKLANVAVVACLFLVLFSILGVNLFAACSQELGTLNVHGNFKNFWAAFVTLVRASTGEAWNEIMHDLQKTETDFFHEGGWCSPGDLFDPLNNYDVLQDKCLIEQPNACVTTFWGWNALPWMYWTTYTLFFGLVIMNIVVAVILEGYDESKSSDEGLILDICKNTWEKYDPDHTMALKFSDGPGRIGPAIRFILDVCRQLQKERLIVGDKTTIPENAIEIRDIPMRMAKAFDLGQTKGTVSFYDAVRQILRIIAVCSASDDDLDYVIAQINECDDHASKQIQKLKEREAKVHVFMQPSDDLKTDVAATKVQRYWRQRKASEKK